MASYIDIHTHDATEVAIRYGGDYAIHAARYFRREPKAIPIEETVATYRSADAIAVLLATDAETNTGLPPVSNDYVAGVMRAHPDVFLGFASVDPLKGRAAVDELEYAIRILGLRGVKFQQIMQGFDPSERRVYPLYELARDLGVPVMFHTGMTAMGAGVPGGDGLQLGYGRPILIDPVAAAFPQLTIIAAHPAWPWLDELVAIAMHKSNVYIDLSGWAPKRLDPGFIRYVNAFLGERCLFGTDYPFLTPERWLREFADLPIKDELRPLILFENARRILRLDEHGRTPAAASAAAHVE